MYVAEHIVRAKFLDRVLRPRPFSVLDAVGQEFVGCSNEKSNVKSSRVCFTGTYSHDDSYQIYIFVVQLPPHPRSASYASGIYVP